MITNVLPLFHILRVHYEWEMDCFILQGRVSTLFRWGGHNFSHVFVTFLPAYSNAKIVKIECVFPELWSQMYCHVSFGSQCISFSCTRKPAALDRGQTNRISLTHNLDLDLQSPASHDHELFTCQSSRSTVSWYCSKDRLYTRPDGRRRLHYLTN